MSCALVHSRGSFDKAWDNHTYIAYAFGLNQLQTGTWTYVLVTFNTAEDFTCHLMVISD